LEFCAHSPIEDEDLSCVESPLHIVHAAPMSIPNALCIELLLLTSNTSWVAGGRQHVPTATRSTRARILAIYSSAWAGASNAALNQDGR
jgi:hypothetical protein